MSELDMRQAARDYLAYQERMGVPTQSEIGNRQSAISQEVEWLDTVSGVSWDRARELAAEIERGAAAICELGKVLAALRQEWFAPPQNNLLRGNSPMGHPCPVGEKGRNVDSFPMGHPCPVGEKGRDTVRDSPVPYREKGNKVVVSHGAINGWRRRVEDELGISYKTAERYIEKAQYTSMMMDISEGEEVVYVDSRGESRRILPTEALKQQAGRQLKDVVAGTVNAKRAWAGLLGEGSRRDNQGGSEQRSAVDHYRNIRAAVTKLGTSLPTYTLLDMEQRMALELHWATIAHLVPMEWLNRAIEERTRG